MAHKLSYKKVVKILLSLNMQGKRQNMAPPKTAKQLGL